MPVRTAVLTAEFSEAKDADEAKYNLDGCTIAGRVVRVGAPYTALQPGALRSVHCLGRASPYTTPCASTRQWYRATRAPQISVQYAQHGRKRPDDYRNGGYGGYQEKDSRGGGGRSDRDRDGGRDYRDRDRDRCVPHCPRTARALAYV